jgi:hypothetical protein
MSYPDSFSIILLSPALFYSTETLLAPDKPKYDWAPACTALTSLLEAIPKTLLGYAAVRIGAHARAARYFEVQARADFALNRKMSQQITLTDDATTGQLREGGGKGAEASGTPKPDLFPTIARNDYANGCLPVLSAQLVDYLMEICARLGDADTLQV